MMYNRTVEEKEALFARLRRAPAPIAPVERIELPNEWNARLLELERKLALEPYGRYISLDAIAFDREVVYSDPQAHLNERYKREWERVRGQYTIAHPTITGDFESKSDAARFVAYYLPKPEVQIEDRKLLQTLMGRTSDWHGIYGKAFAYAKGFTAPESPERARVVAAQDKLWEGYSR